MLKKTHFFLLITSVILTIPTLANASGGMFDYFVNKAKVAATQLEVRNVAQMIYLDYISGTDIPESNEISNYIREHNRSPYGVDRDTAYDFWGSLYVIIRDQVGFKITSPGIDQTLNTSDDISYGFHLE